MTAHEAERARRAIDAVLLGGLGSCEAICLAVLLTGGHAFVPEVLAAAFACAFLVFELTIHTLAYWWSR